MCLFRVSLKGSGFAVYGAPTWWSAVVVLLVSLEAKPEKCAFKPTPKKDYANFRYESPSQNLAG